jgi:type III pantothenate kinase
MVNIAIDRGNSTIKIGVFDKGNLIADDCILNDINKIIEFIEIFQPDYAIISSVVKNDEFIIKNLIESLVKKVVILDHLTSLPFNNNYKTPETLGKDRLAAVASAQGLFPEENVLIIDAGTAITYDLLIQGSNYLGGDISPGLEMRLKALNSFTSKLPLVQKNKNISFPGGNTHDAIASGSLNGMIFEIEGYRNFCKEKYGSVKTIITGGDADFLVEKLKKPIFVDRNLVLKGLNRIMENNA